MTIEQQILSVTESLSCAQASDPIAKDEIGFNNADYPLGFVLAASGDVMYAATLLKMYPRQVSQRGISSEKLDTYIQEQNRVELRKTLSEARQKLEGQVAWAKLSEDKIICNGVRLSLDTVRKLRKLGATRTNFGWELDAKILGKSGEKGILSQDELDEALSKIQPRKDPSFRYVINVTDTHINWNYGGDSLFTEIKELVKPMASGFESGLGWKVTPNQKVMVAIAFLDQAPEAVDYSALTPFYTENPDPRIKDLMDEIRSNSLKVKVAKREGSDVTLCIRKYDATFVETCKVFGTYVGEPSKGWKVPVSAIPSIVSTLLGYPRFDVSNLDEFLDFDKFQEESEIEVTETPTGLKLFPHQIDDLKFLLQDWSLKGVKGGLLANSMGLGKTISSMMAAHMKYPMGRKLVVVPAVAKLNWEREIKRFLGEDQTVQVVNGRSDVINDSTWVIINYDIIASYKDVLIEANFSVVILDEFHMVKDLKANRAKALIKNWDKKTSKFIPGVCDNIPFVIPMSGTPMLNRPKELFTLFRAIDHTISRSKSKFEIKFCGAELQQVSRSGRMVWNNNGSSNQAELIRLTAPLFRQVQKEDVLNLPPKIISSIPIELTKAQMGVFNRLFESMDLARAFDDEDNPTGEILQHIGLLQHETARVKVAASIELAETIVEAGEKVIIFTMFTDVLNEIKDHFGEKAVYIDGSVTGPKRQAAQDAFQTDPSIQVLVANIKAAGVAITLTAATACLHNDRPWTPGLVHQATDRCYRIGQTKTVNVYYMTANGTFDEELVAALSGKSALIKGWEEGASGKSESVEIQDLGKTSALSALIQYAKMRRAKK